MVNKEHGAGDKFIIEIDKVLKSSGRTNREIAYRIKNSDILLNEEQVNQFENYYKIPDDAAKSVEYAYEKGLSDAWECAEEICGGYCFGAFRVSFLKEIFGVENFYEVFAKFDPRRAIEKIKNWKMMQQINVGDIVSNGKNNFIVTKIDDEDGYLEGFSKYNGFFRKRAVDVRKTGEHIDLTEIFSKLGKTTTKSEES